MEKTNINSMSALTLAIEQENDGIQFYIDAANKCKHPLGKTMFQSFVEDEKEHLKRLKTLQKVEAGSIMKSEERTGYSGAKERLKSVFSNMRDTLKSVIQPETDDLEAIKIAMNIEMKGHELYKNGLKAASNPREKELYRFLAKEEIIHFEILKNTYNYLDNLDKWKAKEDDRGYDLWIRMINEIKGS